MRARAAGVQGRAPARRPGRGPEHAYRVRRDRLSSASEHSGALKPHHGETHALPNLLPLRPPAPLPRRASRFPPHPEHLRDLGARRRRSPPPRPHPRFPPELLVFLPSPSISAISAHAADVRRAADWVAARVTAAGMEHVQILPTGVHPVVYADWLHAPGKPTILIYGHFDVQPVDPLDLWTSPPFVPVVRDDKVFARGATDDKGNMLVPILAVE